MQDILLIFLLFLIACVAIILYKLYRAVKYGNRILNRKSNSILGTLFQAGIPVVKELLSQKSSRSLSVSEYQYLRKPYYMHESEYKFFIMLQSVIGNQFYIFPQIHLTTLFDEKIKGQSWKGARSHIDKKSVDFVLCDKNHIVPLLAIELDGNSHELEDRQERDLEVERIFRESKFPLLRIPRQEQYDQNEIITLINQSIFSQD